MKQIDYIRERVDRITALRKATREETDKIIQELTALAVFDPGTPEAVFHQAEDLIMKYDRAIRVVATGEKEVPVVDPTPPTDPEPTP